MDVRCLARHLMSAMHRAMRVPLQGWMLLMSCSSTPSEPTCLACSERCYGIILPQLEAHMIKVQCVNGFQRIPPFSIT